MKTPAEALNLIHSQLQKLWLLGDQAAELANPALNAIKSLVQPKEPEPVAIDVLREVTSLLEDAVNDHIEGGNEPSEWLDFSRAAIAKARTTPPQRKPVPPSAYESLTRDMTTIAARGVPNGVPVAEFAMHALADAELREHDAPQHRKPLTDEQKNSERYLFLRNNANAELAEGAWRASMRNRGATMDESIDRAIEAANAIKG
jgi:hypothetical protein